MPQISKARKTAASTDAAGAQLEQECCKFCERARRQVQGSLSLLQRRELLASKPAKWAPAKYGPFRQIFEGDRQHRQPLNLSESPALIAVQVKGAAPLACWRSQEAERFVLFG